MLALRRFVLIMLLFALCAPVMASAPSQAGAQSGTWSVESITPLNDLLPLASQWALAAPDASHVAAVLPEGDTNQACVFDLATATSNCVPLPVEAGRGFMPASLPPVVWSPDNQRLAIVGNPLQLFVDNDLTVVDFAAQTATVLAPDETTGTLPISDPGEAIIDVQPAWSPDGTRIAVERTLWGDESDRIGRIAIVDATTGEEIASLEQPVVSADGFNFGVTMALTWAPDGTRLAFGRYEPNGGPERNGVWLIDVESGEAEPIISLPDDVQPFMTAPRSEGSAITQFVWAPDGSAALVWVMNPYVGEQRVLLYDVAAGTLSALPRPDTLAETISEVDAAWAPDSSAVIVSGAVAEGDPDQRLVEDARAEAESALWVANVSASAAELLGYMPRVPVPSVLGAWNAEGGVLLAGYQIQLVWE